MLPVAPAPRARRAARDCTRSCGGYDERAASRQRTVLVLSLERAPPVDDVLGGRIRFVRPRRRCDPGPWPGRAHLSARRMSSSSVLGATRDTDADGRAELLALGLDDRSSMAARTRSATVAAASIEVAGIEQRELLAAEPGGHVGRTRARADDMGDGRDDGVTRQMPVGVVDVAQEVEVDHAPARSGPGRARRSRRRARRRTVRCRGRSSGRSSSPARAAGSAARGRSGSGAAWRRGW